MLKSAMTSLFQCLLYKVFDDLHDLSLVLFNANDVATGRHDLFILPLVSVPVSLNLIDLTELSNGLEELIGRTCLLRFEECVPENDSIGVFKRRYNFFG